MPLDDLSDLIKELRERIDAHGAALKQSEALTRYALIDPLLRALGWNTADPALVVPEYKSGGGLADYALLDDNRKPLMMVEAKKLDTPLGDVVKQVIGYCLIEGTEHFSVTDGSRWEVYGTNRPGGIDKKRIVSFDLKGQDPAEVALQALALWRPGVQAGHVTPGHAPVVVPPDPDPKPTPPRPDGYDWQPISKLNPQSGSAPPTAIRFPDNSTAETKAWSGMLVETVRWLINHKQLDASHCPIQVGNSKGYRVAATPVHPNGNGFGLSVQVGPLHVEKLGNIGQMVQSTRFTIEHVGQDPSRFHVGFAPPK